MEKIEELHKKIKLVLIRIGIKCDLTGFTYLMYAVELAIEQPMLVYNLRNLFAELTKRCGAKSAFRVEANIQNAINVAYNSKGFGYINEMYGMEILKRKYKPTTAEIIKLVAEYISLGLYKNAQ